MIDSRDPRSGWAQRINGLRTRIPQRRSDISQHPADGGVLLFDAQSGKTLLLNDTAAFVWQACADQNSLGGLTEDLSETYEVDAETAADHVEQLVALFAESGLLMLEPAVP